jgi:hypothetical protein
MEVGLHFQCNQATGSANSTLIYRGSKKDTHIEVHVLCYMIYQILSSLLARFSDCVCIMLLAAYRTELEVSLPLYLETTNWSFIFL